VEKLIPALSTVMEGVMAAHAEAAEARERLRNERQRIALAGGGVVDRAAWRADAERLERRARAVQDGLKEILAMGGVPKDLSLGLVDFLHLREGEEVNLCWKHGEQAIRYWHGLGEGYAGRKPL
jgi:hypothetical protein